MVDLTPFQARIKLEASNVCTDPRSAFLSVLASAGFSSPKALSIGRIDRIESPEDRQGKKSGWYIYQEFISDNGTDTIGIGHYGCWKSGISEVWTSKSDNRMTFEERAKFHESRERIREAQKVEELQRQTDAAEKAVYILSNAHEAESHPYYTKKSIKPISGVYIGKDGRLIVPVMIVDKVSSIQTIDDNGQKRFMTGGKIKAGYFHIKGSGSDVYVAEGIATAASIHEATGCSVYVAFNAGNIYEVASMVKSMGVGRLIIAGDDDTQTPGNVGRSKAEQAANGLGCDVIFPNGYNDFNDMHAALGIDSLRDYLQGVKKSISEKVNKKADTIIDPPSGVMSDICDYYNSTSGNEQRGFAIQTALGLCSVILGRNYRTSFDNYPSLFLLNVGKSGTGKEHPKTVIERILHESGKGGLISGDGYTSAGAVFSALMDKPKHISVIDEFGRYLEAGSNVNKGNIHQREANTKLMESIGRAHSIMRPPSYSSMTLKKDQADALKNRMVYNPAITLVTMTTPSTLFKTLDMGAIKDGFVNRFIISISDAERVIRKHKQPVDVPERIIDWISSVDARHGKPSLAVEPASPITIEFSTEAIQLQEEFQQYCIDMANGLERFGMEELSGRSNEMAMRISLICALSRDPMAEIISAKDMEWSIKYVKHHLERTVSALKLSISGSEFEGIKKEILADLRKRGDEGITWSAMQKNAPYSKHKPKDLREIMTALKEADLAFDESGFVGEKGGRPTVRWVASG